MTRSTEFFPPAASTNETYDPTAQLEQERPVDVLRELTYNPDNVPGYPERMSQRDSVDMLYVGPSPRASRLVGLYGHNSAQDVVVELDSHSRSPVIPDALVKFIRQSPLENGGKHNAERVSEQPVSGQAHVYSVEGYTVVSIPVGASGTKPCTFIMPGEKREGAEVMANAERTFPGITEDLRAKGIDVSFSNERKHSVALGPMGPNTARTVQDKIPEHPRYVNELGWHFDVMVRDLSDDLKLAVSQGARANSNDPADLARRVVAANDTKLIDFMRANGLDASGMGRLRESVIESLYLAQAEGQSERTADNLSAGRVQELRRGGRAALNGELKANNGHPYPAHGAEEVFAGVAEGNDGRVRSGEAIIEGTATGVTTDTVRMTRFGSPVEGPNGRRIISAELSAAYGDQLDILMPYIGRGLSKYVTGAVQHFRNMLKSLPGNITPKEADDYIYAQIEAAVEADRLPAQNGSVNKGDSLSSHLIFPENLSYANKKTAAYDASSAVAEIIRRAVHDRSVPIAGKRFSGRQTLGDALSGKLYIPRHTRASSEEWMTPDVTAAVPRSEGGYYGTPRGTEWSGGAAHAARPRKRSLSDSWRWANGAIGNATGGTISGALKWAGEKLKTRQGKVAVTAGALVLGAAAAVLFYQHKHGSAGSEWIDGLNGTDLSPSPDAVTPDLTPSPEASGADVGAPDTGAGLPQSPEGSQTEAPMNISGGDGNGQAPDHNTVELGSYNPATGEGTIEHIARNNLGLGDVNSWDMTPVQMARVADEVQRLLDLNDLTMDEAARLKDGFKVRV